MAGSAAEAPTTPDMQPPAVREVPDVRDGPDVPDGSAGAGQESAGNSAGEPPADPPPAPVPAPVPDPAAARPAPSAPRVADADGVRASDAERDQAVGELREHFAAGRMSQDTFLYRMNTALGARNQSDLPPLFADLPRGHRPRGWLSTGWAGSLVHRVLGALSGHGPADGPGDEPAPQRGLTTGFPAAPDRAFDRAPVRGPVLGPAAPRPAALPFPRGVAQTFTIGRDRSCDLAIDHLTVSRVHARLQRTGDGWRLSDLGSTNGTRVNGWRVRGGVDVRAGDLVRFGDVEYALGEAGEP